MGTRHIIAVQIDGNYKVAQYGQWDGYPKGQGQSVLEFLRGVNLEVFRDKCRLCSWATDAYLDEKQKALDALQATPGEMFPELSCDTSAKLLPMILMSNGLTLVNEIAFCADSLMCEWVWVIDFDKRTFEAYEGWNKAPLDSSERFAGLKMPKRRISYYQCKLLKKWSLDELPSDEDFESTFSSNDDEGEAKS